MKKSFLLFLVCALLCIGVFAVRPAEDGYVYILNGDVNGDGEIKVDDCLYALRALVNTDYIKQADTNQDGKVLLMDVINIVKAAVGVKDLGKTADPAY